MELWLCGDGVGDLEINIVGVSVLVGVGDEACCKEELGLFEPF